MIDVSLSSDGLNLLICVKQLVWADFTVPYNPLASPITPCQASSCLHHTFDSLIAISQVRRRQIRQMEARSPFNHSVIN